MHELGGGLYKNVKMKREKILGTVGRCEVVQGQKRGY